MPSTKLYRGACGDHSGSTRATRRCRLRASPRKKSNRCAICSATRSCGWSSRIRSQASQACCHWPAAHSLGGGDVAALAVVGVAGGRELGGALQAVGGHEAEAMLGHRQQRVGLHQVRQRPGRILGDRGVEVVQRIAVVRQHAPQRLLGMLDRAGRARADRAAAGIDKSGTGAALRGGGLGRDSGVISHRRHCSSPWKRWVKPGCSRSPQGRWQSVRALPNAAHAPRPRR